MLQEFPTLVVITISNEGAKPGVCPMLLLQVHIGQAAPHPEVSNIGLAAIPELKGGTAYCTVGEPVVDVVGGKSSHCPPEYSHPCSGYNAGSTLSQVPEAMLWSPSLLRGCTHSVLGSYAMLLVPGCNPVPNELSSLVISDCDQLASRVLGLSHCLVLLECL